MSYKNKVFQKLFETKEVELSKGSVELKNSSEDFKSAFKAADKDAIMAAHAIDKLKGDISKALSLSKKAEDGYNITLKKYQDVSDLFKQIGVPVIATLRATKDEAEKNRRDVRGFISSLEKAISSIK